MQTERDEALAKARKEESGRKEDKDVWRKETKEMDERHRRILADRDQASRVPFSIPEEYKADDYYRCTRDYRPKLNLLENEFRSVIEIWHLFKTLLGV